MKYFAFTSIQFGNENQEGWQCCQAPDFLCLIGLWGLRTHTSVFRHTSIKAKRYSIAGQLWILYTFNFHLSLSRALNHDNKWAIRLSWLMASITISWRYPPANLYLLGESIYNLCNFKSMLGTSEKFQMGGAGVIFNPKNYVADYGPFNKTFWAWNLQTTWKWFSENYGGGVKVCLPTFPKIHSFW